MDNITRFFATYRLELRLTCLHWSYLALITLWSGFVVLTYLNDDLFSTRAMFNFAVGLSSLIGLILTGVIAMRVQRNRFDVLETAFPTGFEITLARWLATITAIAGLLIAPLGVALVVPSTRIEPLFVSRILLLSFLAFAFITGLIWIVQNTVGVRRWMHPFFAGFWLLGGMIPGTLMHEGLPVPGINLLNFITMESVNNSLWGTLPQGQLPLWFTLFYTGLVMLFGGVLWWHHHRMRFYRHLPAAVAVTVLALCLILFAGGTYTAQVAVDNQQIRMEREMARATIRDMVTPAEMPFIVTDYDLTFAQGEHAQFSARLNVLNQSDTTIDALTFSLYHQFEVTSASLPFERDDNVLTLHLPEPLNSNETTAIDIHYQGEIRVLDTVLGRASELVNFTHPQGVNLSYTTLWYPVPGRIIPNHTVYDSNSGRILDYSFLDEPATFRLTIEDTGNLMYTSNLTQVDDNIFASDGANWVELIGAERLQTQVENGITLVTPVDGADLFAPLAWEFYTPLMDYIRQHFPRNDTLMLHVLDTSSWYENYPATAEHLYVRTSPRYLSWIKTYPQNAYRYGGEPLFASLFGGQSDRLTENVVYFLWAHYSTNGDVAAIQSIIEEGLPFGGSNVYFSHSGEIRYQIASKLYDIYSEQGETTVFDLLRTIQQEMDSLRGQSTEAIITWIEDRSRAH